MMIHHDLPWRWVWVRAIQVPHEDRMLGCTTSFRKVDNSIGHSTTVRYIQFGNQAKRNS